jgi:LuxR family maltose regulon positive regulatory protein
MAAHPDIAAAWNATPLTKFRAPRVRRDAIARPVLLRRLAAAIESCPVTLICAPGGFGKTTLMAQFAAGLPGEQVLLWISVDVDDNDRHRFFATLLHAVEPLQLAWEIPPATLLANAAGSDSQARAALASFVNALCTAPVRRIVLVFDDLHSVDEPSVFEFLESLIERLPDHVALVLGSRVEPLLPLARWRAHGELHEIIPWDLQFSEADAATLAAARLDTVPDPESIREAVRRTHGWAAGLAMVLQSTLRPGRQRPGGSTADTDRHLFAYLAQEVLADLPADMREFVLHCSVLTELSPDACTVVTERTDSRRILEALYRRNLFLTATDDAVPVLRFHDLFREFLQSELERRYPQRIAELHERAGRAEQSLARAVAHFIKARRWAEAIQLIIRNGETMLAGGDHAVVERWIDQIPESARRHDPWMSYLRGFCGWLRWDWPLARRELQPAVDGFLANDQYQLAVRALFLQVDAFNSSGEGSAAWEIMERIEKMPLDSLAKAQLALQRAWYCLLHGEPDAVGKYLGEFIAFAEQDPGRICPQTADRIHCLCIGLPGVADAFERFYTLSELVRGQEEAPWHLASLPVGAWAHLWHGRREPVPPILERGASLHQKFGGMRLVSERLLQFRALFYAATEQYDAAEALMASLMEALMTPEAAMHRAVWLRGYQHGQARLYWMSDNIAKFRALAPALLAPRVATEWPFVEPAAELVRGQLAMLREDWPAAQAAFELSMQMHRQYRMPMTYGDPRVSLAYMHLLQGERAKSWSVFAPLYAEVTEQQAVGLLLFEPPRVRAALLEAAPADVRRSPAYESLQAKLALWSSTPGETAAPAGPLAILSDREREVLEQVAAGASNKHIARDLNLSLHTVKRHIANILDKLDCASRGQAADLWRRVRG